jgi:hypothetical protein
MASAEPATPVGYFTGALTRIFRAAPDKHEAHRRCRDVLQEMSGDRAFLTAVLAKHLQTPGALSTKHYPVVGINIELNPYYSLEANCWIPLPDRATDVTTKAIHHHGSMLLTTATAFGPGYEHWTFQRPELADPARQLYRLPLIGRSQHALHHVAFVDSYIAHVPMYPPALTITLALWSNQRPTTWKDRLKRFPLLKRHERILRRLAAAAGLKKALDLKVVENFDFHPADGGFRTMRERVEFPRGPNEDYLHSLFHILQETGNEGLAPLVERQVAANPAPENPRLVEELLGKLRSGRPIEARLPPGHFGVPFANFTAREIERALAQQPAGPDAAGEDRTPGPVTAAGDRRK